MIIDHFFQSSETSKQLVPRRARKTRQNCLLKPGGRVMLVVIKRLGFEAHVGCGSIHPREMQGARGRCDVMGI